MIFAVYRRRSPAEAWQLVGDWDDELMACSLARARINIDHSRGFSNVEALVIKVDESIGMPETLGDDLPSDYVLWASDGTHDEKFIEMMKRIDGEIQ